MDNLEIWGVYHEEISELVKVISAIESSSPKKIGLELCRDTLTNRVLKGYMGLVSKCAIYQSIEIIPLDKRKFVRNWEAIFKAILIKTNKITEDCFLKELNQVNKNLKLPSSIFEEPYAPIVLKEQKKVYEKTLKIAKHNYSMDQLLKLFENANRQREKYSISLIKKHKPQISIVGSYHLESYKKAFPNYKFTDFYPHKLDIRSVFK